MRTFVAIVGAVNVSSTFPTAEKHRIIIEIEHRGLTNQQFFTISEVFLHPWVRGQRRQGV